MQTAPPTSGTATPSGLTPGGLRAWAFLGVAAVLGFAELATLSGRFFSQEPTRLAVYLALVAASSCFRLTQAGSPVSFSLNIPLLLACILDLSVPEATLAGAIGALVQTLRAPSFGIGENPLQRWGLPALSVGVQTMAVATASFAFRSLLPQALTSVPLQLAAASLLLFAANTLPVAIAQRLGQSEELRIGALWRAQYFWAIPYYLIGGALAQAIRWQSTFSASMLASDQSLLLMVALYLAHRQYRTQRNDWAMRERHSEEMAALHLRAIEGLALAVEAKDVMNTRGHLRRVQVYALGIARAMGLSDPEMEALHAGSLLHDIGKLAVPEHILTKPGKLTAEEFAKMKVHPLVGAEIVDQMQFPYPVAPIVRAHHEKWDGTGYPYGLKGEQIPIGARILTVVDFLDAMTSDREYRRGVPLAEAMRMISAEAGKSFDPRVVEALEANVERLESIARQQAAEGPVLSIDAEVHRGAAPGAGLDLVGLAVATGTLPIGPDAPGEAFRLLAAELGGVLANQDIFLRAERVLLSRLRFDAIAIFIPRGNEMVAEFARGRNAENFGLLEVPVGQGVTGWVAQNMQAMVNGNPSVDPGLIMPPGETLQSVLAVPLVSGDRLEGVLALYREVKDAFTREEARLITAIGPALASALQNATAHQQIQVISNTDTVTGVPNEGYFRRIFADEMKRAERRRQNLCLVLLELNGADSAMLAAVGNELRRMCRDYDRVGRMGENRFALLLPGLGPQNISGVLGRIRSAVESAGTEAGAPVSAIGLGGAFYPADGDGERHILSVAENRLAQGTGNWEQSLAALLAVDASSEGQLKRESQRS